MTRCPACGGEVRDPAAIRCPYCGGSLQTTRTRTAAGNAASTLHETAAGGRRHLAPRAALDGARFPPGHIFARRFRIVSLLGRGGSGEVYRAEDLRLGQSVAVKLLSAAESDETSVQRFTSEVRLARGIVHPNVCRVFDIGEAEG